MTESIRPINPSDKRVVNGHADINQLAPFKYPWAWDFFLNANKNHWLPTEIDMTQDIHDYRYKLNDAEKHLYENVLAYLTTSDILAMRNIGLAIMEKMSAPELQIYQARQVYEEALHTHTYQNCIENLGLDQGEIYNRYRVVPEIYRKIKLTQGSLDAVLRPGMDLTNRDDLSQFVMSYVFFAAVFEGSWFYNGFSPVFALARRGIMRGTSEQFQYIMRDEYSHASFGIMTINTLLQEEGIRIDPKAFQAMWDEAHAAEEAYARYLMPGPMLGISADDYIEQFRFMANRRSSALNMPMPFLGARCAMPWLDEMANIKKEKNFFESRVTEYQIGCALDWD
jgi:ribonucleoside-diphosphate reductase beta chain